MDDRVALNSCAHPKPPWYRGLLYCLRRPKLSPDSIEQVEIERLRPMAESWESYEAAQERKAQMAHEDYIRSQLRKSSMTDQEIEKEIKAKGLTAPRITPADIENTIIAEAYITGDHIPIWLYPQSSASTDDPRKRIIESLSCLTVCVLVLQNGFTVTGESACASPANFNEELGRKIARQKAVEKIWALLGYELRSKLLGEAP